MSNKLLSVLQYMEKEKGIPREAMIEAIVESILGAAQKGVNMGQTLKIDINPKTGALRAWSLYNVVDSVTDTKKEIHLQKAQEIQPGIQIGAVLEQEIDPSDLGRIAAQTARQAIMQKIRQFEKDRIFDKYKDLVGTVITGIVRRQDRGDIVIELGELEAILRFRNRIPGENYAPGERIRCLLLNIETTSRGPELVLTRTHADFVRRLLEIEISEVADGTVVIENITRDAGYRTKICVRSTDSKVDPVGACIGARGARVKSIVRELGGEKVDVIRYDDDPEKLLREAVKPAIPQNIVVDNKKRCIHFEVSDSDIPAVIGWKGKNAKLTSAAIGWGLDISTEKYSQEKAFQARLEKAVEGIHQIPSITEEAAQKLVQAGINSIEAFEGVEQQDLQEIGFTEAEAADILQKIKSLKAE